MQLELSSHSKLIRGKKGFKITTLLFVVLVLAVLSYFFITKMGGSFTGLKSQVLHAETAKCKSNYEETKYTIQPVDDDNDMCVDNYDVCLDVGINQEQENLDQDKDGMPDRCDKYEKDADKFSCKDYKVKNSYAKIQCCTPDYVKKQNKVGIIDCTKV